MELQNWDHWWNDRGAIELRGIFLKDWDPLLVGDSAQAQDEYDVYLQALGSRLRQDADTTAVAEYLCDAEKQMGLDTPAAELTDVAVRIVDWYRASVGAGDAA